MQRTKSLQVKKINNIMEIDDGQLAETMARRFSIEGGYGFTNLYFDESHISSTLVYITISKQQTFDLETNSILETDKKIFHYVPFELDLSTGFLKTENAGFRIGKLISILGLLLNGRLSVEDIYIDLQTLLEYLEKRNHSYRILRLSIANYSSQPGVSGKYEADISSQQIGHQLITDYNKDIKNLELEIVHGGSSFRSRISCWGSITVRCEEDDLSNSVDFLMSVLWEISNG